MSDKEQYVQRALQSPVDYALLPVALTAFVNTDHNAYFAEVTEDVIRMTEMAEVPEEAKAVVAQAQTLLQLGEEFEVFQAAPTCVDPERVRCYAGTLSRLQSAVRGHQALRQPRRS